MINLTNEDKEAIRHLGFPKILNLSCGSFLVKKADKNYYLNELIGYKLASIFKLVCPKYYLCDIDGEKYLLSEDLNKLGDFRVAGTFLTDEEVGTIENLYYSKRVKVKKNGNNIYDIWDYLENNYKNNSRELMLEIIKVYIFYILFGNSDRRIDNWGLIVYPDNSLDITIFDNEDIFKDYDLLDMNVGFKSHYNLYADFTKFLSESDGEFKELFKYYFDLVTPEVVSNLILDVALELGINLDDIKIKIKKNDDDDILSENKKEEEKVEEVKYKDFILSNYKTHRTKLLAIYNELIKEVPHAR